jgi:hypothetical protein
MNQGFIAILQQLISEQGKEALLNPAKCKAFLADYTHGEYKKESRLLLQALEAGVPKAILTTVELEICKQQQVSVLKEEHFLSAEAAADVVDALTLVLRGGQEVSQGPTCPNCGKELQKEWKGCPYCLTLVAKIQQSPPPVAKTQESPPQTKLQPLPSSSSSSKPKLEEDIVRQKLGIWICGRCKTSNDIKLDFCKNCKKEFNPYLHRTL